MPSTRISSLDELVAHCKIDLQVWAVERWICNKWEMAAKTGRRITLPSQLSRYFR